MSPAPFVHFTSVQACTAEYREFYRWDFGDGYLLNVMPGGSSSFLVGKCPFFHTMEFILRHITSTGSHPWLSVAIHSRCRQSNLLKRLSRTSCNLYNSSKVHSSIPSEQNTWASLGMMADDHHLLLLSSSRRFGYRSFPTSPPSPSPT